MWSGFVAALSMRLVRPRASVALLLPSVWFVEVPTFENESASSPVTLYNPVCDDSLIREVKCVL